MRNFVEITNKINLLEEKLEIAIDMLVEKEFDIYNMEQIQSKEAIQVFKERIRKTIIKELEWRTLK